MAEGGGINDEFDSYFSQFLWTWSFASASDESLLEFGHAEAAKTSGLLYLFIFFMGVGGGGLGAEELGMTCLSERCHQSGVERGRSVASPGCRRQI